MKTWLHKCLYRPAADGWRTVDFLTPRPRTDLGVLAMLVSFRGIQIRTHAPNLSAYVHDTPGVARRVYSNPLPSQSAPSFDNKATGLPQIFFNCRTLPLPGMIFILFYPF